MTPSQPSDPSPEIAADVLVIGGGLAGCSAAMRALDLGAAVVLVDKAYVSRSGCSPINGGVMLAPSDEDDLDAWTGELFEAGDRMIPQGNIYRFLVELKERISELRALGMSVIADATGKPCRLRSRGMNLLRGLQYIPAGLATIQRTELERRGCRILDRIVMTDLLTSDGALPTRGHVSGAVGFHVRTGRPVTITASSTILAGGPLLIKGIQPAGNVTGDPAAMAFRAGADLVDLEMGFGGTFSRIAGRYRFPAYNVAIGHGARLVNAHGERFMERWDPVLKERAELGQIIAAFVGEIRSGRGPVFLDLTTCDETFEENLVKVIGSGKTRWLFDPETFPVDIRKAPLLVEPHWAVNAHQMAGIRIDEHGRTTIPGLYAVGSCAKNNIVGKNTIAGLLVAFCTFSGYRAGGHAAAFAAARTGAAETPGPGSRAMENLRAHLSRLGEKGGTRPEEISRALLQLLASPFHCMGFTAEGLAIMLATVTALEKDAALMTAGDPHELVKLVEALNMVQNCRIILESALDRTESRGNFCRADYPYADNDNWFCWHLVRAGNRTMSASFEKLPVPNGPAATGRVSNRMMEILSGAAL